MNFRKSRTALTIGISAVLAATLSIAAVGKAEALDAGPKNQVFVTSDKVRLVADVYSPVGASRHPAVILVHQLGEDRETMESLVKPLINAGFIVVNLDMRGHGRSTMQSGFLISFHDFKNQNWAMLPSDLNQVTKDAAKMIPNFDGKKLAIIGASIGANAALIDAGRDMNVKAVIALSPGLNFHDLQPATVMPSLKRIPVLLLAAKNDSYSTDSVTKLSKMDPGSSLKILESGGHGYQMLVTHQELNSDIATWLHKAMP
ncbi:MAG TPA: alpha/beta fold hydrolase [Drouetiella sp.]